MRFRPPAPQVMDRYCAVLVDEPETALWRRRPKPGQTVHHSGHGTQYTSLPFGSACVSRAAVPSRDTIGTALRQRGGRKLLRLAADRTARPDPLDQPYRARQRDLRMDRVLLQPVTRHSTLHYLTPNDYDS